MNYDHIYKQLINHRQANPVISKYSETHHIKPKSLGGSDEEENLVKLTAREHYIAHLLLLKINPCMSTSYAVMMMQCGGPTQSRAYIKNSRMYEWARLQFIKHVKENQSGSGNSQYGTKWICNVEERVNRKISREDKIPSGWVLGRDKWKAIDKMQENQKLRNINEEKKRKAARKLYNQFLESDIRSIRQFVKQTDYPYCVSSLTKSWKKYVPEYKPQHGMPYNNK